MENGWFEMKDWMPVLLIRFTIGGNPGPPSYFIPRSQRYRYILFRDEK